MSAQDTQDALSPPVPDPLPSSEPPSITSSPGSSFVSSNKFLLPIPTPSTNKSQSSFALPDVGDCQLLEEPGPEILAADISISADGSFVETTSGQAARELKKRYDQMFGVSKDARSPYVITAIVNQHGKSVYRVGMRSQSAAPTTPSDIDLPLPQPKLPPQSRSHSHRPKRPRMSINALLVPVFNKSGPEATANIPTSQTHSSPANLSNSPPRRLRKSRSIPDLFAGLAGNAAEVTPGPQAGPSGRAHSQSVTAADMPKLPIRPAPVVQPVAPSVDTFMNAMNWSTPSSPLTTSTGRALPSDDSSAATTPLDTSSKLGKGPIEFPFGRGVSFDSPHRNSAIFLPPIIREMQSFESGLTARVDSYFRSHTEESKDGDEKEESPRRPQPTTSTRATPSFESCQLSKYSSEAFDVIQTYRGLPLLDTLSADSAEPTIKMSLSSLDGAAPRDDPRFVIWGEANADGDDISLLESFTEISSSHSGLSRKRSTKAKSPIPELRLSPVESPRRVLLAATIERWIAQLTSQFDYDELLIFFLTYRTYVDSIDLCHLFICRFHWALEEPMQNESPRIRQVVRVRTFVAIRFWLMTFFQTDFLPNRELRLIFAKWLNTLRRDAILKKYPDSKNIVKKLIKVVKDCKEKHARQSRSQQRQSDEKKAMPTIDKVLGDLSNSVNFAASLRKMAGAQEEDEDSDIDLDFVQDGSHYPELSGIQGFEAFSNPFGSTAEIEKLAASASSPAGPPQNLLQHPLHMAIMQHAKSLPPSTDRPLAAFPVPLPVHHNPLSRAVTKTIGKLGRWKRVLSSRSSAPPLAPCADMSAFDLELNATGDLLTVRGGVEQYLKMIEPSSPLDSPHMDSMDFERPETPKSQLSAIHSLSSTAVDWRERSDTPRLKTPTPMSLAVPKPSESKIASPPSPDDEKPSSDLSGTEDSETDLPTPQSEFPPSHNGSSSPLMPASPISIHHSVKTQTHTRSLSRTRTRQLKSWHPEIVSIDDLDLSDLSSEDEGEQQGSSGPPGLRKAPRRLPHRREFEFVRRSVDSVSSMGITSHRSIMSDRSNSVASSHSSSFQGLGGNLQQWQFNALIDDLSDDEGPGDAEAALRRLEGQINHQQQRAKEAKVNGWVRAVQERLANGNFRDEPPRNFSDDDDDISDEDYGTEARSRNLGVDQDEMIISASQRQSIELLDMPLSISSVPSPKLYPSEPTKSITPTPEQSERRQLASGLAAHVSPTRSPEPARALPQSLRPKVNEAVPSEILKSRLPSRPSTSSGPSMRSLNGHPPTKVSSMHPSRLPTVHRSFVLNCRSEVLVQQFSVIDREIFLGIKFEELVCEDWVTPAEDLNVLDWAHFLKERRRRVELRGKEKVSALSAARARFNLVANFVISEILLSHPTERVPVTSKFIRIAWKAYLQNNFATLVPIITGLCSDWVKRALGRSWGRVGIWEQRVFEDLRAFTTSDGDFRFIRQAVEAITDAKSLGQDDSNASISPTDGISSGSRSRSNTEGKPAVPKYCIPFFGAYLSQLHGLSRMPDLIDPTAPNEPVTIDPVTGNFVPPAHTEVFATLQRLPTSMQLEPLINVQKQRLIAGVIESLVAGQHLANKVEVQVDKKLLQRCLKLRALDSDALNRILTLYSET